MKNDKKQVSYGKKKKEVMIKLSWTASKVNQF